MYGTFKCKYRIGPRHNVVNLLLCFKKRGESGAFNAIFREHVLPFLTGKTN
jgi:hypothetical protein